MSAKFIRATRLKLVKKEQIKNILRLESLKTKTRITMIYISFENLLTENDLNTFKFIFCNGIRCSFGVYKFILLKSSIKVFSILNEKIVNAGSLQNIRTWSLIKILLVLIKTEVFSVTYVFIQSHSVNWLAVMLILKEYYVWFKNWCSSKTTVK